MVGVLLRGLADYATNGTKAGKDFAEAVQMVHDRSVPNVLAAATAFAAAHERSSRADTGIQPVLKLLDDAEPAISATPGVARFAANLRAWIKARDRAVAALI